MNLCIDVGNTTINFGFYKEDKLLKKLSFVTSYEYNEATYLNIIIKSLEVNEIKKEEVNHIILSSVVPSITNILKVILIEIFSNASIYELDSNAPHALKMDVDNPSEVGSDLIADLVGAKAKYDLPLLVIDLGTATKLLLLDKEGMFISALIMPGVEVSAKSLFANAALLPEVDLNTHTNLLDSKNTINCIKHGILFGHLESIYGLASRYEKEIGYKLNKVVTGGNAEFFKNLLSKEYTVDDNLVLDGERIVLDRFINN